MSARVENATLIGAGAAACAVCCAGPILGFVAALGIGAVAGAMLFGLVGIVVAIVAGLLLVTGRRRRRAACLTPVEPQPVTIVPGGRLPD